MQTDGQLSRRAAASWSAEARKRPDGEDTAGQALWLALWGWRRGREDGGVKLGSEGIDTLRIGRPAWTQGLMHKLCHHKTLATGAATTQLDRAPRLTQSLRRWQYFGLALSCTTRLETPHITTTPTHCARLRRLRPAESHPSSAAERPAPAMSSKTTVLCVPAAPNRSTASQRQLR